jgi:CRISPR-associated protein Cmr6
METRRKSLNRKRIPFAEEVNLGLWLDKFIEGQDSEKKSSDDEKGSFESNLISQAVKIKAFDEYKEFFERRQDYLAKIKPNVFKAIESESRMIIGLSGESVWENSISIHRTYGVPFIPGSALKGLAASYARKYLKEFDKSGKAYEFIFGSQESAGFIMFHDALLLPESAFDENKPFLHAEIMTVHHQDYYGVKKDSEGKLFPPADWDSPVPINFISASGKYQLVLTGVEGCEDWLNIVVEILSQAFQEEGIGAKTSSGYGRAVLTNNFHKTKKMEEEEREQKRLEEEKRRAEIERQKEEARLAEESRRRERQLAFEAEQQAKAIQKQQQESLKIQNLSNQISELTVSTKKKVFEKLSKSIHNLADPDNKKRLALEALKKIEQLQSENSKVDVPDICIKSLKKMGGIS